MSHDIAKAVYQRHKEGRLKVCNHLYVLFLGPVYAFVLPLSFHTSSSKSCLQMFKLEDVAMGIWIEELKKEGSNITYRMETRVYHEGCSNGYVVAHYQSPREMLCLWQNLKEENKARCCRNR